MFREIIVSNNKKIPIIRNEKDTEKILVFVHGLDGTASEFKLFEKFFQDFSFISITQRGHENDEALPASWSYKKYVEDLKDILQYYKKQNKKIYLLGGSMGGAFSGILNFLYGDIVESVFLCSVPNKLVNLFKEKRSKKFLISLKTVITYLFNINFKFKANIDFELLSNNKKYIRISNIQNDKMSQTRNSVATWKANRKFWRLIRKRKAKSPTYFFYGNKDVMLRKKLSKKRLKKAKYIDPHFHHYAFENAKHIILHELDAPKIFKKINEIMNK